jgi:hypothetical protein
MSSRGGASAPARGFFAATLVLVAAFVSLLHLWKLGTVPAGFYVDESSIAYNAYSVAKTGADEYGIAHPLFFRCFDNHQDPVMIYSIAPLVNAFGLTEGVARFPSALFALLAAAAFALVTHEYCRNRWFALLGGTVFAIVPWVFPISRTVMAGYTPMLFGMALGWWLLLVALRRSSFPAAVGAGFAWAFAMVAHNMGRPITALLLIAFALLYRRRLLAHWKRAVTFAVAHACALAPMIVSVLSSGAPLTTRFGKISIFVDDPALGESLRRFFSRYIEYFSPGFLFLRGDSNLRHHTGVGGELFVSLLPLIVAGLYVLLRGRRERAEYRFVLLGLLLSPAAAALTMERMHATRSLPCVLFWLLATVIGAQFLWQRRGYWRLGLLGACLAGLIEGGRYYADYFGAYQTRGRDHLLTPVTDALRYSFEHLGPDGTLYVSSSFGTPIGHPLDRNFKPLLYAHLAFYGKVDPRLYQRDGLASGRIRYYDGPITSSGLLLRCNAVLGRLPNENRIVLVANPEPLPPEARLVHTIPAGGAMHCEIYELGQVE